MKKIVSYWNRIIAGIALFTISLSMNAQLDNFEITIRNVNQTAQDVLEFDVYLLDRDAGQAFELGSIQLGIVFNSLIHSGGTVSASYDNTGTGLNASQQFNSTISIVYPVTGYPDLTLIRLAGRTPPGAGNGSIISTTGNGTLVTHITLTSTVGFAASSTSDLEFCASTVLSPLYATRVSQYQGTSNEPLAVTPGTNAIVYENPVLNPPPPVPYAVTGGGSFCSGEDGMQVGLSDSETGVTYTLIRNGLDLTPTVPGTGNAISFGLQEVAGTYTVRGTNAGGSTSMTGSAIITVLPLPVAPVAQAGSGADCSQITANWQASAGATAYFLDVSTSNTFATFVTGFQDRNVGNVLTYNVTGLTAGTNYYYRVRSQNTCGTSGNSGTITYSTSSVVGTPTTPTPSASTICQGTPSTAFTTSATNATGYVWSVTGSGNTVTGTGTTGTVTWSPTFTGVATVSVHATGCGTSPTASTTVTVRPTPTASISGTTSVCQGVSAPNLTFTNPQALPVTVTYNINGSNEANINIGASTSAFLSVPTTSPGTFAYNIVSVSYQAAPSCPNNAVTGTATVTVNALPTVNAGTDQTIANGTSTTLTGSVTGTGPFTYSWTPAAQVTSPASLTTNTTVLSATTVFTLTATSTSTTCVNSDQITINVSGSALGSSASATPSTICAGASVQLAANATGGSGTYTYSWTSSPGTFTSTIANPTVTPAVTTIYTVVVGDGFNIVSSNVTVTVNAAPPQPVITADGPISFCTGEDVVLTAPESAGYLWSNGATTRSITVSATSSFSVQVTNAAGCQSVPSPTVVVTVNPLPSRPTINPPGSVNICTGTSQTLTSSAGVSYLWSNGEFNQSISVNTTGSYTVRVTNSYGCLSPASLATTVTVNPIPATPTITASGSTTLCSGGSVTLSSSLASGYLWSTGEITRNITVNSAGNYWVRVTDAAGCQSAQSTVTAVTVNPLPSAPTVGTITHPTCTVSTGSVVLGGLPAGSWTVNPGGITGTTSTVTVTGLVAGSHTFTVTNSTGCTSVASAPVAINTQPAVPTVPIVGTVTQPTCAVTTGSVGFSGLPSTGMWTLTRLPGGNTTTGSGTTTTLAAIPSGSYTFTVTNASGCTSAATGPVTINAPLPVPAAPVQTVDCTLGFNQGVVTVTSPTGAGYEFRLDAGGWQSSNIFSNVVNGTHRVTVRNSSGCITIGPEFSVSCGCANPPLLTLGATTGSTCGVTAVIVSGNTFGGSATSVTITENGGGTVTPASSSASPFSFTYTPTAADAGRTVVITVTTNNPLGSPCAAASATYTLTVNANPVAPVPGTVTHPACALPSGSVILNNLPAAGEWTVTRSPGGTTTTGSGTSTTITGLAPGTYSFTVTNSLGCTSPASGNVVINTQPDIPGSPVIGALTQPTCALSTGSVELSGLPATGTWTLTRLPGNFTVTGTGATRTVTGISAGTWTFTVANAAGCVSPPSAEFVINTQPVTPPAPLIGMITHPTCALATGSIVLENLPANGEWILVRYPGGISSNGTGTSATVSSLAAGTYNFTVTNADGCPSPVSANAIINAQPPTPNPPVVGTITHPTLTVGTGSVVLSGLPSSGTWTLTRYPDGFTSQGTGTTRTVSGLEPGTYTFTVTNSVGCTSAPTDDVVINARPGAPLVVINNPPNICSDQTANLTLPAVTAGSDANLTFTYWTDAAATLPLAAPATVPAGTYYIMGTSTAGYSTIRPVVVTADELPVANAGPDEELSYIFGTTLNAEIPSIGTGIWELVSGTGEIFNSTAPSTQVNGLTIGDNIFSWTVTNGACYPVTDFVTVKVNNLIIPTLITPNQDGANDYLVIQGIETLGRTELMIFDRRGLKVYENSDYDNLWDGVDYNSNPLPEDTYFYVVRAQNGASLSGYIVVRR